MDSKLVIYNTLTRKKEIFKPIHEGHVGMYVCGPTVYGDAHLGHSRPAITFDLLFRYLKHLGYKVRYVRNITDVGHLVNDEDSGEDKIGRKAKLEELEPMEIVQMYSNSYRENMNQLNVLPPSIEPSASGHIIEQIESVKKIVESGYGYEANGSIYFDVEKYAENYDYGKLSGRKLEDLYCNTRELEGQEEKRSSVDFALWKKATPEHIMRWPSPWSEGFPGWHIECTAMSTKYLGTEFDIHGGGMDLLFPHHEAEIAQSVICNGHESARYWMHNNLITINGQKMGKSLGNFITLREFFAGKHDLLDKEYSPMTIRFFMLQAHYRSPLDFSNKALQSAEKGLERLMNAVKSIDTITPTAALPEESDVDIASLKQRCYDAMNDDLNSPVLIAELFNGVKIINSVNDGSLTISADELKELKQLYHDFVFDILGIVPDKNEDTGADEVLKDAVELLLDLRLEAKKNKDWATADKIREQLNSIGIVVKDTKEGASWEIKR